MVSSISDTVREALSRHGLGAYQSHAQPVVDDLMRREQDLAREIIAFAESEGMDDEATRTRLEEVGMHVPALEPVSVATGTIASAEAQNQGDTNALLARIAEQLDGLTAFARENGYQG